MSTFENLKEAWELYKEHPEAINDWESNFLSDNYARFEQYEERTKFSDKQGSMIEKILEKLRKV